MRRLVVVLALFGLVLGVVCAVVMHYLPIGDIGWFAYTPVTSAYSSSLSVSVHPRWWPSIAVVPAVGIVAGAAVGLVLDRLGWTLARSDSDPPSS